MNYIDELVLDSEIETAAALGDLFIKEYYYMEANNGIGDMLGKKAQDFGNDLLEKGKNAYNGAKKKVDDWREDYDKNKEKKNKEREKQKKQDQKDARDFIKDSSKTLRDHGIIDKYTEKSWKAAADEEYDEARGKSYLPKSSNFFVKVFNWIKRAIKTIVAKMKSKTFHKLVDNCSKFDVNAKDFKIISRHKDLMDILSRTQVHQVYKNKKLTFVNSESTVYRKAATSLRHTYDDLKRQESREEYVVKINGKRLQKYMNWLTSEGELMVTELPNLNKYLSELSKNLSDSDRKSRCFHDYVQFITIIIELDLLRVKHIIEFLKYLSKNNEVSGGTNDPNVKLDNHKCEIIGSKPSWVDGAALMEDIPELGSLCKKGIRMAANSNVRDKYPNVDNVYVTRNKSSRKFIFAFNAKETSDEDWRQKTIRDSILSDYHLGKFEREMFDALDKHGAAYLVLKR